MNANGLDHGHLLEHPAGLILVAMRPRGRTLRPAVPLRQAGRSPNKHSGRRSPSRPKSAGNRDFGRNCVKKPGNGRFRPISLGFPMLARENPYSTDRDYHKAIRILPLPSGKREASRRMPVCDSGSRQGTPTAPHLTCQSMSRDICGEAAGTSVDRPKTSRGKRDRERLMILAQMLDRGCLGYDEQVLAPQQPGERDLRCADAMLARECREHARGRKPPLLDRAIRHRRHMTLRHGGQKVEFDPAPRQIIEDLIRGAAFPARGEKLSHVLGVEVAHSPMADLAGAAQGFEGLDGLGERHFAAPMQEIEVDTVRAEPPQAALASGAGAFVSRRFADRPC